MEDTTKNITKIDPESYKNILSMANSPDKENQIVALTLVENIDYKKNMAYILVLKKQANIPSDMWKEHAPMVHKKLTDSNVDPDKVITFKKILMMLIENGATQDDLDFYCKSFASHMKEAIKNIGYDHVDDLEITVKLKKNDKS